MPEKWENNYEKMREIGKHSVSTFVSIIVSTPNIWISFFYYTADHTNGVRQSVDGQWQSADGRLWKNKPINRFCRWSAHLYSFFIVFLKRTAGMMKFTVYLYLISFPSYRTFYILSCDVISCAWDNANKTKVWSLGDRLIKFNETWHT
jgi:hypothetical protein